MCAIRSHAWGIVYFTCLTITFQTYIKGRDMIAFVLLLHLNLNKYGETNQILKYILHACLTFIYITVANQFAIAAGSGFITESFIWQSKM